MTPIAQRVAARYKAGASEIEFDELPADRKAFVKKLEGKFGKAQTVWDGIHGIIVDFPKGSKRLSKDVLEMLTSNPDFRWIEADDRDTSVGM